MNKALKKAITSGKMHHAYLLGGPEGTGKTADAIQAALMILCKEEGLEEPCMKCSSCRKILSYNHPDFRILFPFVSEKAFSETAKKLDLVQKFKDEQNSELKYKDIFVIYLADSARSLINNPYQKAQIAEDFKEKNRSITVDHVRELIEDIHMPPTESKYKVIIIQDADLMNAATANALLKTLEEPPLYVRFILISSKLTSLLPTIRSRCQELKFKELTIEEIKKFLMQHENANENSATFAAKMALGSIQNGLELLNNSNEEFMNDALEILESIQTNDLHRGLFIATSLAKQPIEENMKRLKYSAVFLREMNLLRTGNSTFSNDDSISERIIALTNNFPTHLYPKVLDKITDSMSAIAKKSNAKFVFSAFFIDLTSI